MTRINGTVHCTDDVTFLDVKSIMITRERAIGGCILRALTTSDEAVVGDDNSIRRTNLGLLVLGRPLGGQVQCYICMHDFQSQWF